MVGGSQHLVSLCVRAIGGDGSQNGKKSCSVTGVSMPPAAATALVA